MLIIDGDYPMAYGAIALDRDLTCSIGEVRSAKPSNHRCESSMDNETMATLPEMRRGGIAVVLAKICVRIQQPGSSLPGYRSGDTAYAVAQGELAYFTPVSSQPKARFMNLSATLTWANMMLWHLGHSHSVARREITTVRKNDKH